MKKTPKQLPYPVIHIFICLFFHVDFKDAIKYTAILSKFYTFYENHFPRSDTRPTQVGEMDPWPVTRPNFERSDWLRSENFISIMIE